MQQAAWDEESEKLKQTVARIDELIDKNERSRARAIATALSEGSSPWTYTGYTGKEEDADLHHARLSPYFGRVDVVSTQKPEEIRSHYIGRYYIPVDYVYSLGTVIGHLFYDPFNIAGRILPDYLQGCTVTLKRILTIHQAELVGLQDALRIKPGATSILLTEDIGYLTKVLSDTKGHQLKDIIVTIQPEQYQVIASTNLDVVAVDGVAGSGKTEIGLHRIVYLLSPSNELKNRIIPERVAFFGPSRAFLSYVANLLPGLGVEKVASYTMRDWLRKALPSGVRLQKRDVLMEQNTE